MSHWLFNLRPHAWSRYSVAVYVGLLLAGTLRAKPPEFEMAEEAGCRCPAPVAQACPASGRPWLPPKP